MKRNFLMQIKIISINLLFFLFCHSCKDFNSNDEINDYGIVINEINYNSSDNFDPDDWIEIYNSSNELINIGFWMLKDENDDNVAVIPESTLIAPNQYIIFCKDSLKFSQKFPNVIFHATQLNFGLSGSKDAVRIFDSNGTLADIVEYKDDPPWPGEADGEGATLELKHPSLDNSYGYNWAPSSLNGTPGNINSSFIEIP